MGIYNMTGQLSARVWFVNRDSLMLDLVHMWCAKHRQHYVERNPFDGKQRAKVCLGCVADARAKIQPLIHARKVEKGWALYYKYGKYAKKHSDLSTSDPSTGSP